MDHETISQMKVAELKSFLRLRGLKVTGRKAELVSRVYSAVENNVPVLKTAEEIEYQIKNENRNKLFIDDTVNIANPFEIDDDC